MQKSIYIILFLFFYHAILNAQQYTTTIKQYTEKDGLSSNEVFAIAKDQRGVIWVATKYGLNRFDGKHFKEIANNGINNNTIDQIFSDQRYLWLFHKETAASHHLVKNIDILDIYSLKITSLAKHMGAEMPFKWSDVLHCDWIEKGIFFELRDHQRFIYQTGKGFQPQNNFPLTESPMYLTASGDCWLARQQNDTTFLTKRNWNGQQIGTTFSFPHSNFQVDCEDDNGTTYFAMCDKCESKTENRYRIAVPKDAHTQYTFRTPSIKYWFTNALFIPSLQILWFAADKTLTAYNLEGKEIFKSIGEVQHINSLYRQNLVDNNAIWHCSHSGIYRIELKHNYFSNWFPQKQFRSIIKNNNIFLLNNSENVIKVTSPQSQQHQYLSFNALSAAKSAQGGVWLANFYKLHYYDPLTQKQKSYNTFHHEIWGLYEDTEGRVWLSQQGLSHFNPRTEQFDTVYYGQFEELRYSTIYHFYQDSPTHVWLCATSGLYRLNITTRTIEARYSADANPPFYLPANDFRHLYFDANANTFWLATAQGGLIRWDLNTQQTESFLFNSGITNVIHSVYPDDFGFLWLSTEKGVIQFQQHTKQFKIYTTKDGLANNEFNRVSHFQDTDGTLYFGSVDGITIFHPKDFKNLFNLKIQATPFVVEVEQYLGKTNRLENITEKFEYTKQIYLQPDDRFFTLTLGLKEYDQADVAVYFYKLKKEIGDWTQTTDNKIMLAGLPYGNQVLLVKVLLANGQFAETILAIPIYVQKPFYLTTWFILLLLSCMGGFVYWRVVNLKKQNLDLESEVKRRTAQIQKDKVTIEQQTTELRKLDELKSRFFANISHELRTPITLILNPLNQLLTKKEKQQDQEKLLTLAHNNSKKLLRLVNEILDLTKLEAATLQVELSKVDVIGFVTRIMTEFEALATWQEINISLAHELGVWQTGCFDVQKVETILYNLLSNAFKFTPKGGQIRLKISAKNTDLQIEVMDTGCGIHETDLPYIFNRFYQSKVKKTSEGGTGLGLALSKELANLLRGEIWVKSEWGKGSHFYLFLPNCLLVETPEHNYLENNIKNQSTESKNTLFRPELFTILLVEDNRDLQQYMADILFSHYNIVKKDNGEEALTYLNSIEAESDLPHLIISDIMMPIIDGYQLLTILKASIKYRNIPVIVLTARVGLDDKLKALRIGVDDYLTKPFIETELLARINNLLENYYMRKQIAKEEAIPAPSAGASVIDETIPPIESLPPQWLDTVARLVYENMSHPNFSIEFLSELLGISRYTFNRHIKQVVGMTGVQYLQELRLDYARKMLENKEVASVKAAAEMIGISDTKYFSRLFKTRFGKLPSEYLE